MNKKLLLTLGSSTVAIAPILSTISCSTSIEEVVGKDFLIAYDTVRNLLNTSKNYNKSINDLNEDGSNFNEMFSLPTDLNNDLTKINSTYLKGYSIKNLKYMDGTKNTEKGLFGIIFDFISPDGKKTKQMNMSIEGYKTNENNEEDNTFIQFLKDNKVITASDKQQEEGIKRLFNFYSWEFKTPLTDPKDKKLSSYLESSGHQELVNFFKKLSDIKINVEGKKEPQQAVKIVGYDDNAEIKRASFNDINLPISSNEIYFEFLDSEGKTHKTSKMIINIKNIPNSNLTVDDVKSMIEQGLFTNIDLLTTTSVDSLSDLQKIFYQKISESKSLNGIKWSNQDNVLVTAKQSSNPNNDSKSLLVKFNISIEKTVAEYETEIFGFKAKEQNNNKPDSNQTPTPNN